MNVFASVIARRFVLAAYFSSIPSPPTTCCMSGCHNCVWIKYAHELSQIYQNSEKANQEVLNQIEDVNLKAFIQLELKWNAQTKEKNEKN
jgi:hypothetical protein